MLGMADIEFEKGVLWCRREGSPELCRLASPTKENESKLVTDDVSDTTLGVPATVFVLEPTGASSVFDVTLTLSPSLLNNLCM